LYVSRINGRAKAPSPNPGFGLRAKHPYPGFSGRRLEMAESGILSERLVSLLGFRHRGGKAEIHG
jgi:hypothetical protein